MVVAGDVNGDSECDVIDVAQIASVSTGLKTLSGVYESAADIDMDGTVDVNDYQDAVNLMIAGT